MIFYNLLLYFLFPLAFLRLFSKKEFSVSELNRIRERLGPIEFENCSQPIWIHAVSVGEVKVATLIIKELKSNLKDLNFLKIVFFLITQRFQFVLATLFGL